MLHELDESGARPIQEWSDERVGLRIANVGRVAKPGEEACALFEDEDCVVVLDGRLVSEEPGADASSVAQAYRRVGIDCGRSLRGEFAFVLWDKSRQLLLAGCDPVGLRSLAYCSLGETLLVSSRVLAVLRHRRVPPRLDRVYLAHALCDLWAQPPGMTPFAAIRRIRPGFALTAAHGSTVERRVDALRPAPGPRSRPQAADHFEQFWACLEDVVRDAADPAATLALELSGGLDSTSVAVAAVRAKRPVDAVSIVAAAANGNDERRGIEGFLRMHPSLAWYPTDCSRDRALGEPWHSLPIPDDPAVLAAAFLPARLLIWHEKLETAVAECFSTAKEAMRSSVCPCGSGISSQRAPGARPLVTQPVAAGSRRSCESCWRRTFRRSLGAPGGRASAVASTRSPGG